MTARRKYEDAQGVVALHWKRGAPSEPSRWSVQIGEVWRPSLDYRTKKVMVRASLGVLAWDNTAQAWTFNGRPLGSEDEIRRYAVLGVAWANIPLTVGVWEVNT